MTRLTSLLLLAAVAAAVPAAHAQSDGPRQATLRPSAEATAKAVATVRGEYFAMDYARGAADGARLVAQFPESRELAAWHVANLARLSRPKEAQTAATALMRAYPNDAWSWFARTLVLEYQMEGGVPADVLRASAEAYRRAPTAPDIIWVRALALSNNGQGAHAVAFIDSVAARGPLPQALRTQRAAAMFSASSVGLKVDQARRDSAFVLFAAARASDSTDVTATAYAAGRMLNAGRYAEGYQLAKHGAELSPSSLTTHETYWRAVDALKDRPQAARDSEVLADLERFVATQPDEPTVLSSAATQYDAHRQPDKARAMEEHLLAVAPTSMSAEWVVVSRYRAAERRLRDTTVRDTAGYRRALWTFVDRPTHISERLLGDAYRSLFSVTDSTTSADTLLRIVRGMVRYEGINPHFTYSGGAIRLAQRGRDYKEAERIAHDGLKEGRDKIDSQKDIYETVGDYAQAQDWMAAFMYDALGYVYFREGRRDDALRELTHARELDPRSATVLLHLGQVSEAAGKLDDAERFYTKGSLLPAMGTNTNRDALKRVYAVRHGSLDGYGAYLASLAETDRVARKAEVAGTRIAAPRSLEPFRLKTLDGRTLTPDSLRGAVTVINNWGMWCGPCVAEMPEFQKLSVQFAHDTAVRILTIDNDANTDSLRTWLGKKGYTFTTLLDDGYLKRINVPSYPTTWFIDPAGRIVFTKVGWSEKLVEEFGWRIELLKPSRATP